MQNSADRHRHDLIATFGYAFAGLETAWRTQPNMRIHTAIAVAVTIAGVALRFPPLAWGLVAIAIALVVGAELLNTAVEAVVDLVSPEEHPLAKRAKDLAAAAVLVTSFGAVAIGAVVAALVVAPR